MELQVGVGGLGKCTICGEELQGKELHLRLKGESYHLRCYRGPASSLAYATQLSTAQKGRINAWLLERAAPISTPTPVSSAVRRVLLSVFSYLTILETEQSALVNHSFFYISRDNDLWQSRYTALYAPLSTQSCAYRVLFKERREHTCWHCRKGISTRINIHFRLNQPLCSLCAKLPSCRAISIDTYCQSKGIERSLAGSMLLPTFKMGKKDYGYVCELAQAFIAHAKKRIDLLSSLLHQRGEAEITKNAELEADLQAFYSDISDCGYSNEALLRFCGLDDRKESLERSVNEYIKDRWMC